MIISVMPIECLHNC